MTDEIQSGKDWIELNIDNLIEQQQENNDDKEMLSTCCGYSALTEIHYNNESKEVETIAICSKCLDWADFEHEEY